LWLTFQPLGWLSFALLVTDVIGAISAGMRAAWVQRSKDTIFDPWGIEPTITVSNLGELYGKIG
jgi:FMN phosphatase YigB (HAD superfamily)